MENNEIKPSEILKERAENILRSVEDVREFGERGLSQISLIWPHASCTFIPSTKESRSLYVSALKAVADAAETEANIMMQVVLQMKAKEEGQNSV